MAPSPCCTSWKDCACMVAYPNVYIHQDVKGKNKNHYRSRGPDPLRIGFHGNQPMRQVKLCLPSQPAETTWSLLPLDGLH